MSTVVEFDGVSKTINQREIINNLSFKVEKGKTFALLGPNGAGKTTTVRLLTGLLSASSGSISLFGNKLQQNNSDQLRKRFGVQNDGNLYENLTVFENLDLWGKLYGLNKNSRNARITEIIKFFELEERINSNVGELSKGMRQKVLIARAVFHSPEILVLDEPTSGLDPQSTDELIKYLKSLVFTKGLTIIMCTHQLQGLEDIADDIGIIQNGHITKFGSSNSIIREIWPTEIYELEAVPNDKAVQKCMELGDVTKKDGNLFEIKIFPSKDISDVVKVLVDSNILVRQVTKKEHSIKDAYLRIVGEHHV